MFVRISGFENTDTILDIPSHVLRGNVITAGQNYTIRDGKIGSRRGYLKPYGEPSVVPYWLLSGAIGNEQYWLYAGLEKIYLLESSLHTNATRQVASVDVNYAATVDMPWTGGAFNGLGILNNQNDIPQVFSSLTARCANMANWPSTLRCKSLRPFRNFLIAANVIEGAGEYPQVLRWSHPADPGAVPTSWDYTNPTTDTGRIAFAETKGILVDSLSAQDVHIVYKNDSTYYMQFVGAPNIFNIQPISLISGLLSQNCMVNVPGGQVALTYDDVVFVTPRSVQSIADKRVRKHLFAGINFEHSVRAFLAVNPAQNEVWVCIPAGTTYASLAYIWRWTDNKWSLRTLPDLLHMAAGFDVSSTDTWDAASGTHDSDTQPWGTFDVTASQFLGVSAANSGDLFAFDAGATDNAITTAVSVVHDSIDALLGEENPKHFMVLVKRLRPHFTPESLNAQINFEVGMRNTLTDTIRWTAIKPFTVGTTRDIFVRKQGRYLSWRITSNSTQQWELDGMDVEFELGGEF